MEENERGAPVIDNPEVGHEATDVSIRAVLIFGVGLAIVALIIHIVVWFFYALLAGEQRAALRAPTEPVPPVEIPARIELQVEPESELSQLRSREEQVLRNYGWVDRDKGIVRIPIDRAMEIIAAEGLPARKQEGQPGEAAKKGTGR